MKILAVKWRRLGDTVLWTAALQALREFDPEGELHVACPAGYGALFEGDDRFRAVHGLEPRFADNLPLLARLRRECFDWVLNFHASRKSLWFSRLCGARGRLIHHHSRRPRNFSSQRPIVDLGRPMAATERDLNVVRTLGWSGPSPRPRLPLPEIRRREAAARWGGRIGERPLVLLGPFASRPAKQWPLERYAALAESLSREFAVGVVYDDEALFAGREWIRDRLAARATLMATPRLEDLNGALSLAACFVGGDSGVKHLAAAVGVPTVTLFGPESLGEWHPYDAERHPAIQKAVPCRENDREDPRFAWCGVEVCPYASHACLSLIFPEEVAELVRRVTR